MTLAEPFKIIRMVAAVLERLNIPYYVGDSLASSFHGIPRTTQDVDIVAAIEEGNVPEIIQAFAGDFYIDEGMIRQAVANRSSFNIIHLESMFKVDIFILKKDPLSHAEMARRQSCHLSELLDQPFYVASAEDTILQKLN